MDSKQERRSPSMARSSETDDRTLWSTSERWCVEREKDRERERERRLLQLRCSVGEQLRPPSIASNRERAASCDRDSANASASVTQLSIDIDGDTGAFDELDDGDSDSCVFGGAERDETASRGAVRHLSLDSLQQAGTAGGNEEASEEDDEAAAESCDELSVVSLPTPPDGGWGWVVVLAAFAVNVIVDGISCSYGVFFMILESEFGASKSQTALVGSLFWGVPLLAAPLSAPLINKCGCRAVCMTGALIAFAGVFAAQFANSLVQLCVTYGLLAGFGLSMVALPSTVVVAYYFETRRAFATGLSVAGSGVGTFVLAPLTEYLVMHYDWRSYMMLLSGIVLNLAVCGALLRPIENKREKRQRRLLTALERFSKQCSKDVSLQSSLQSITYQHSDVPTRLLFIRQALSDPKAKSAPVVSLRTLSDSDCPSDFALLPEPNPPTAAVTPLQAIPEHEVVEQFTDAVPLSLPPHSHTHHGNDDSPHQDVPLADALAASLTLDGSAAPHFPDDDDTRRRPLSRSSETLNRCSDSAERDGKRRKRSSLTDDDDSCTNASRRVQPSYCRTLPPGARVCLARPKVFGLHLAHGAAAAAQRFRRERTHATATEGAVSTVWIRANPQSGTDAVILPAALYSRAQFVPLNRRDIFYRGTLEHVPLYRTYKTASCPELYRPASVSSDSGSSYDALDKLVDILRLKSAKQVMKVMLDVKLFGNLAYLFLFLSNLLLFVGYNVAYFFLTDYAVNSGVSGERAPLLVSLIGILNTAGQVVIGYVGDRPEVNTVLVYAVCIGITGLSTLFVPSLAATGSAFIGLGVYAGLFGFFFAANVSLGTIIMVEAIGLERLTNGFSLMMCGQGVANIIGPPLLGWIIAQSGGFPTAFYTGGILLLASAALIVFVPLLHRVPRGDERHSLAEPPLSRAASFKDRSYSRECDTANDECRLDVPTGTQLRLLKTNCVAICTDELYSASASVSAV